MKCDDPIFLRYGRKKDNRNYLKNHPAQSFFEETMIFQIQKFAKI